MSDVPTHTIKTPLTKTEVVLKDYITGYDDDAIQKVYLSGAKRVSGAGGEAAAEYDGSVVVDAEYEGIRRVVVSVAGSDGDVVAAVKNLPLVDSKFILAEVNQILNPLADSKA